MVGGLGCWVQILWEMGIWVRWLASGVLPWRIEGEEIGEEL